MKITERNLLGIAVLALGILCITFLMLHIKVSARESVFNKRSNTAEIEFRNEIKQVLKDYGIKNAGVTMTKITEDGVSIDYNISINLPSYKKLTTEEQQKLEENLSGIEFKEGKSSSVSFSFSQNERRS
jgi:hypothetical protein